MKPVYTLHWKNRCSIKNQLKRFTVITGMLFLSLWYAGCNKDIEVPTSTGTHQDSSKTIITRPVSSEERAKIMDTIDSKASQLINLDRQARAQAFAAFLSTLPGVVKSGIDSGSVWGLFADGQPFIINCGEIVGDTTDTVSVDPEFYPPIKNSGHIVNGSLSKSSSPVQQKNSAAYSLRPGIPSGNKARLLNGFVDSWFTPSIPENINPYLATFLTKKGYEVTEEDATVEAFKAVHGDAVLHIRTHGGLGKTIENKDMFALWTTTECTKESEALYDLDLKKIALVRMYEKISSSEKSWHFGITKNFIESYWGSFADAAYVHVSACWGGAASPEVDSFRVAIFKKGAALYTGWSYVTPITHLDKTALFTFDRMLGTNALSEFKVNPPQRPMGAQAIIREMVRRKIDEIDININGKFCGKSMVNFYGYSYGDRLTPSIGYLVTDELKGKLLIYGVFGWEADSAIVTIGGTQVEVYPETDEDLIYCKLAPSGSGSSGDVVVKIRGRESNRVRLSVWNGQFTYTMEGPAPGDLRQTWKFDAVLRGDVHDYRLESGEPPAPCQKWVSIIPSRSSCTYTFEGSNQDDSYRVTWDGSGSIHCLQDGSSDNFMISGEGLKDQANSLWWTFFANKMKGNSETIYRVSGSEWKSMGTNARNYLIPFGRSMAASEGFKRLSKPAEILSDGTIKAGTIGPIFLQESDFTTWYITNWIWSHTLTWTTMKPEAGSGIDDQMPR